MFGEHRHVDRLAGSPCELAGDRLRWNGAPLELLTGGAGAYTRDSARVVAPPTANGILAGASTRAHHGVVGLVVLAVIVLFLLDRAGFRFAVTAGRR